MEENTFLLDGRQYSSLKINQKLYVLRVPSQGRLCQKAISTINICLIVSTSNRLALTAICRRCKKLQSLLFYNLWEIYPNLENLAQKCNVLNCNNKGARNNGRKNLFAVKDILLKTEQIFIVTTCDIIQIIGPTKGFN